MHARDGSIGDEGYQVTETLHSLHEPGATLNYENVNDSINTLAQDPGCQVKIWKLRCKVMAEKYSKVAEELRQEVQTLKQQLLCQVQTESASIKSEVMAHFVARVNGMQTANTPAIPSKAAGPLAVLPVAGEQSLVESLQQQVAELQAKFQQQFEQRHDGTSKWDRSEYVNTEKSFKRGGELANFQTHCESEVNTRDELPHRGPPQVQSVLESKLQSIVALRYPPAGHTLEAYNTHQARITGPRKKGNLASAVCAEKTNQVLSCKEPASKFSKDLQHELAPASVQHSQPVASPDYAREPAQTQKHSGRNQQMLGPISRKSSESKHLKSVGELNEIRQQIREAQDHLKRKSQNLQNCQNNLKEMIAKRQPGDTSTSESKYA